MLRLILASIVDGVGERRLPPPVGAPARRRRPPSASSRSIFHTPALVTRRDWIRMALLGLVGHCLYQYCSSAASRSTSVANGALLLSAQPVVITIFSTPAGERISRGHWIGVAVSLFGIYLVVGRDATLGGESSQGNLLMMAAVVCWATYTIGARSADAAPLAGRRDRDVDAVRHDLLLAAGRADGAADALVGGERPDMGDARLLRRCSRICVAYIDLVRGGSAIWAVRGRRSIRICYPLSRWSPPDLAPRADRAEHDRRRGGGPAGVALTRLGQARLQIPQ